MKNIVVFLVASVVVGAVCSEVAFRRSAARLQQVEARLGAIDRNLAGLNERHAKIEAAVDLLIRSEESASRASSPGVKSPAGQSTLLSFAEFRVKFENALQEIADALDTHDEQITQLQDDLQALSADVEKNTTQIAATGKQ
ncbi:MAG: hypothetical protein HZA93_12440 [Verrucomicrobia bacterium]|nr:hypothetical protein [Verrucomicrobiota bacterium]